jgi:hypothetical protein
MNQFGQFHGPVQQGPGRFQAIGILLDSHPDGRIKDAGTMPAGKGGSAQGAYAGVNGGRDHIQGDKRLNVGQVGGFHAAVTQPGHGRADADLVSEFAARLFAEDKDPQPVDKGGHPSAGPHEIHRAGENNDIRCFQFFKQGLGVIINGTVTARLLFGQAEVAVGAVVYLIFGQVDGFSVKAFLLCQGHDVI